LGLVLGLIAVLVGGFYGFSSGPARVELCIRDMEYTFTVVDETTQAPIAGAKLTFTIEDLRIREPIKTINVISDDKGKVTMLRKDQWCDVWVRPFRKEFTEIDRTWLASIRIEARGFEKIEDKWLYDWKYIDHGYYKEEQLQRIEYVIPLKRQ